MPRTPREQLNAEALEAASNGMAAELKVSMIQGASFTPEEYEKFKVTSAKPNVRHVDGAREVSALMHQHEVFDSIAKSIVGVTAKSICPSSFTLSQKAQNNLSAITDTIRMSLIETYGMGGIETMRQDLGIEAGDYLDPRDRTLTRQMERLGKDVATHIEMKDAKYANNPFYQLFFHSKEDQKSFELPDEKLSAIQGIFSSQKIIIDHVAEENLPRPKARSPSTPYTFADGFRQVVSDVEKDRQEEIDRKAQAKLDAILDGVSTEAKYGSDAGVREETRSGSVKKASTEGLLQLPERSAPKAPTSTFASRLAGSSQRGRELL